MSVQATKIVWKGSNHSGGTLLVLLAIADYENEEGAAWPAVETLARKARMSERNCQYVLQKLVRSGELVIERGKGPQGTHLFHVRRLHPCNPLPKGVQPSVEMGVKRSSPKPSSKTIIEPSSSVKKVKKRSGKKSWKASDLEEIYALYPRKDSPLRTMPMIGRALKILTAKKDPKYHPPVEYLKGAVRAHAVAMEKAGIARKHIKMAPTWFNGGCYLEAPELPSVKCPRSCRNGMIHYGHDIPSEPCDGCEAGREQAKKRRKS